MKTSFFRDASPRPWLAREPKECAFPVSGEGIGIHSCCRPCGGEVYCEGHRAIMYSPRAATPCQFELAVLAWLAKRP